MPGWPDTAATGALSSLLLCAVCLVSSIQTVQINRGAAAGFLLQALVPLMKMATGLTTPLGLGAASAPEPPEAGWVSPVVGLPLLAFGFHWLNGDRSTGKAVATHSVTLVAAVTILIVSVFTSNAYGVLGSLLVGAAGLLAGTGLPLAVAARQGDILHGLMAAANLALCWALQGLAWEGSSHNQSIWV
uniref:Uncharacterized protein n=1 Tax=Varanus komodoensis TaxID=61221 RepID=A0A8D2ITX3_VARKO